jgi:hypothetical protein
LQGSTILLIFANSGLGWLFASSPADALATSVGEARHVQNGLLGDGHALDEHGQRPRHRPDGHAQRPPLDVQLCGIGEVVEVRYDDRLEEAGEGDDAHGQVVPVDALEQVELLGSSRVHLVEDLAEYERVEDDCAALQHLLLVGALQGHGFDAAVRQDEQHADW